MRLKYANGRLRSFVNIIMYSSIILTVTGELFGSSCLKEEAPSKFRRSQIWVGSCSLLDRNVVYNSPIIEKLINQEKEIIEKLFVPVTDVSI